MPAPLSGLVGFFQPGTSLHDQTGTWPDLIAVTTGGNYGWKTSGTSPVIDFSSGATLWVYRDLAGSPIGSLPWIMGFWNSGSDPSSRCFLLYTDGGGTNLNLTGGFGTVIAAGLTNTTQTVAATANNGHVWWNGTDLGTSASGTVAYDHTVHSLYIATGGNQTIRTAALWNRALTSTEMAWLEANRSWSLTAGTTTKSFFFGVQG